MFLYHRFEQILMSATQTMEDVNTTVLIPLAASTVAVGWATSGTVVVYKTKKTLLM